MKFFPKLKIAHKLPLALLGSALLLSVAVGTSAYMVSASTMSELAESHLEATAAQRVLALETYLGQISEDLLITAGSELARTALDVFGKQYRALGSDPAGILQQAYIQGNPHPLGQKHLLDRAPEPGAYNDAHAAFHPEFRRQLERRGYYDIFLFDTDGNLVYTVFKEPDYATNFAQGGGPWADTDLGRIFRAAMALDGSDKIAFEDFESYAPSNGVPAAFMATQIRGTDGELAGVLAYQMPIDRINEIMGESAGLGEFGETFFVGSDGLFRSDSPFSDVNDILATQFDGPLLERALSGDQAHGIITNYRGTPMLAAASPASFAGAHWALLAVDTLDHVMAPSTAMRDLILAISAGLLLLVGLAGWWFSRALSRPLTRLTDIMQSLSSGKLDTLIDGAGRPDEIGAMARSVEVFRQNGIRMRDMAEEEKASLIRRTAERAQMMQDLQDAFGEVVDAAVAGDFSKKVTAQFPDAELNALAASVNNLLETVDRGVSETGAVLGAMAATDLSQRVEGEYRGAFLRLKTDTNAVAEKLTEIVGQLRDTSGSLKVATGEILAGANDLSERTTRQAATVEETSAATQQLSATVVENSKRAQEASGTAGQVAKAAEDGGVVMQKANEAMARIATSSSKISNIIGMIDDIAFQTNLLALNASVEAARAGEAGKGFAVVAIEVRRLAQSAAQASTEVKALIEQSGTEVQTGTKLVAEAARGLETIVGSVRAMTGLMGQIASDSREQASSIEEVSLAVRQMDEMTQHNAALVEQTNAAIEKTEAQATELDQIVSVFSLEPRQQAIAPPRRRLQAGMR